jgi:RHS repeat-associated protein
MRSQRKKSMGRAKTSRRIFMALFKVLTCVSKVRPAPRCPIHSDNAKNCTSKIRVVTSGSVDGYSRLTEVEAYGPADTGGSGNGVHWLVPDHLGTPRIVLDQTGSLAGVKRHDYLPFGEELFAGTGGRTEAMGYTGDGVRQQFTAKERDSETGLDYLLARYYSSVQGRFFSPDEFTGGSEALHSFTTHASANPTFYADFANPQSLNKYHYTLGNPLAYVDPDGHNPCCMTDEDWKSFHEFVDDIGTGALKTAANTWIGMGNFTKAFIGGTPTEPYRPTNMRQAVTMAVVEDASFFAGLLSGRASVGGVAIAEGQTTSATATRMSTQASAVRTANQAQSLPRSIRPRAAGAATAVTGETYTATSGQRTLPAVLQNVLDSIPPSERSPYHGSCCEVNLISQMLRDGVDPKGATISVVRIRSAGHPQHATVMAPCPSCSRVLDAFTKK